MSIELSKVVSQILELYFFIFSHFFLKIKIPPKVTGKGQRCGGDCIFWILLVIIDITSLKKIIFTLNGDGVIFVVISKCSVDLDLEKFKFICIDFDSLPPAIHNETHIFESLTHTNKYIFDNSYICAAITCWIWFSCIKTSWFDMSHK